jgi:hypothetical protein
MSSDPSLPPPAAPPPAAPTPTSSASDSRRPRRGSPISPRLTAALAVLVVAIVVIFLVTRGGNSNSTTSSSSSAGTPAPSPAATRGPATAASAASLRALQTQVGHPVYWAGAAGNLVLAAQKASDGSVYLRYLTHGTPLSTTAQNWLSVVSYPEKNAFALAQAGAKRAGAKSHHLVGGGLAVSPPNLPTNVFLSEPGSPVLVEVFDPNPGTALHDVLSGRIQPVG